MSHTIKEKTKLLARVRRIKGQVEAIERALEAEIGCADVLMLDPRHSDYDPLASGSRGASLG
jgi:Metal-sensitive transcriptional repressor